MASEFLDEIRGRVRDVQTTQCRQVSKTMKFKVTLLLSAVLVASPLYEPSRAESTSGLMRNDASAPISPIQENFVTVEKLRVRYVVSGSGPANCANRAVLGLLH